MAASDFFSRWSRQPGTQPSAAFPSSPASSPPAAKAGATDAPIADARVDGAAAPESPPTIERARQLTPADDFRPFVRPDVDPQVRNVAMRQLFSDPHFNVMDGLDIYIDDYNTPNPLPVSDIGRMAGASILRLIQSEPDPLSAPMPSASHETAAAPVQPPTTQETTRDDPDLRLQPNPATRSEDPGPGPA